LLPVIGLVSWFQDNFTGTVSIWGIFHDFQFRFFPNLQKMVTDIRHINWHLAIFPKKSSSQTEALRIDWPGVDWPDSASASASASSTSASACGDADSVRATGSTNSSCGREIASHGLSDL